MTPRDPMAAIPAFIDQQLAPLRERIAQLERELAELKKPADKPTMMQRLRGANAR